MEKERGQTIINAIIVCIDIIVLIVLAAVVIWIRSGYGNDLGVFIKHSDAIEKILATVTRPQAIATRIFFVSHYISIAIVSFLVLKDQLKNKLTVLLINIFTLVIIVFIFIPFILAGAINLAPIFSITK